MPKSAVLRAAMFASTALGAGMGAPAFAQATETPRPPVASGADIIVTARRVAERLQDVPISITVFNQEQLTARNVVSAGDIASYTPSLTANGRFGGNNTSFAIRGFTQDNGTAPSVAVYFADVVALRAAGGTTLGNGAGPGSFFDLQNVQVLKGAQGTLFGRNTTGGAILLVPQKPTGNLEGYVEGSIGNYDMRRIQTVLNLPVSSGLRVRLGVDRQVRDGFLKNRTSVGPRDFANTDYIALRGSVVADLTANLENYLIATYSDSDTNGFLPTVFACAPGVAGTPGVTGYDATLAFSARLGCDQVARQNASGFYSVENATVSPREHTRQWQVINTTTWKASDTVTVKNIASYGEFREYFRASVYGDNLILTSGPNIGKSFRKIVSSPSFGRDNAAESTFTEEFQVQGSSFEDRLTWQAGAYTEQSRPLGFSGSFNANSAICNTTNPLECTGSGIAATALLNPGTAVVTGRNNKQSFFDYALYGQATYKLTEQLNFTAGARYTWDKTTTRTRNINYVPLPVVTNPPLGRCGFPLTLVNVEESACELRYEQKASRPTWLAGVDYKPTEDVLIYAKYTRGYRAGGLKTDGPPFVAFRPEKVDTYEGGFKTSFRGDLRGTFNVSGFYSNFTNQQLAARLDPTPTNPNRTPPQIVTNGGKSRMWGIEAEASINPFEGLVLEANYAYLNTKLLSVAAQSGASSTDYFPPVVTGTVVGQSLPYTPKNKFTITGTYTLPVPDSVGRISVGATFSHTDRIITTAGYIIPVSVSNQIIPATVTGGDFGRINATDLLNLNASWNGILGTPIDLSVFVTNATGKKYISSVFGGIGAFGFDSHTVGEPRMYGLRVKYRFGR